MLVMIKLLISLLKLTLFLAEKFFSIIYTFIMAMLMEIDALEITRDKDVNLLCKDPHPHGCMAVKVKLSPMLGNYISIQTSKFRVNFAISIKLNSMVQV